EKSLDCETWATISKFNNDFDNLPDLPRNFDFERMKDSDGWTIEYQGSGSNKSAVKRARERKLNSAINEEKSKNYNIDFEEAHRNKLWRTVQNLSAKNGTPTAAAYAEVASYLLGTTTKGKSGSGFTESSDVGKIIRDDKVYIKPTT